MSILDLEIGNNLTIDGSSAYLEVDNLTVGQKLALKNGAVLYSHTITMSEVHKLTINATDIETDSSSSINVLGLGYHTHYTYMIQRTCQCRRQAAVLPVVIALEVMAVWATSQIQVMLCMEISVILMKWVPVAMTTWRRPGAVNRNKFNTRWQHQRQW